jgi:hypothetical protein
LDLGDGRGRARLWLYAGALGGHPGVVVLPIVEPEFWRQVNLVSIRGRRHSPAVGAIVREAMQKKWFGQSAMATRIAAG